MLEPGTRRGFLVGLGALLTAPAIVHVDNLMPIVQMVPTPHRWLEAYLIGTDEVALRADFCYDNVLAVPRGCCVPSPELIRHAERLFKMAERHPLIEAEKRARLGGQHHVDIVIGSFSVYQQHDGLVEYD